MKKADKSATAWVFLLMKELDYSSDFGGDFKLIKKSIKKCAPIVFNIFRKIVFPLTSARNILKEIFTYTALLILAFISKVSALLRVYYELMKPQWRLYLVPSFHWITTFICDFSLSISNS